MITGITLPLAALRGHGGGTAAARRAHALRAVNQFPGMSPVPSKRR
jgi:hypothetical protein